LWPSYTAKYKFHGETTGKYKLRQEIFVNSAVALHVWDHSKSPGEQRAKNRKTSGQEEEIGTGVLGVIHADRKISLEVSVSRSLFGEATFFAAHGSVGLQFPQKATKFPGWIRLLKDYP
jgi:hypothetical protein